MKSLILAVVLALPYLLFGQLGAAAGTNVVYTSNVLTNNAWVKHVLTATGENYDELRDKSRKFVSAAEVAAEYELTAHAGEIEEAWSNGFARGSAELSAMLGQTPSNGVTMALKFPLPLSPPRRALEMYVAGMEYVDPYDYLYIHFSQPLAMKPIIELPYVWNGGFTTNRLSGTWAFPRGGVQYSWSKVCTVEDGGNTYTNCHVLRVERPAALRNQLCHINPHVKFGREGAGVAWGNIVLLVNGRPTLTGVMTNSLDGSYINVVNGAILAPGIIDVEIGQ